MKVVGALLLACAVCSVALAQGVCEKVCREVEVWKFSDGKLNGSLKLNAFAREPTCRVDASGDVWNLTIWLTGGALVPCDLYYDPDGNKVTIRIAENDSSCPETCTNTPAVYPQEVLCGILTNWTIKYTAFKRVCTLT